MKYKTLGNTGLQVSELYLGAMTFGSSVYNIGEVNQDLAQEMVQEAWEAGHRNQGARGDERRGSRRKQRCKQRGAIPKHIMESVDASLERLDTICTRFTA